MSILIIDNYLTGIRMTGQRRSSRAFPDLTQASNRGRRRRTHQEPREEDEVQTGHARRCHIHQKTALTALLPVLLSAVAVQHTSATHLETLDLKAEMVRHSRRSAEPDIRTPGRQSAASRVRPSRLSSAERRRRPAPRRPVLRPAADRRCGLCPGAGLPRRRRGTRVLRRLPGPAASRFPGRRAGRSARPQQ